MGKSSCSSEARAILNMGQSLYSFLFRAFAALAKRASRLAQFRDLAHQPVGEVDFLPEGCGADAFVAAMRACVIQVIEHAIDTVTWHADQARVLAVARTGTHLREDHDVRPQLVSHLFD